ncbi:MAG: hypothetical protein ACK4Z0_08715 [Sphingomonadaceae bacterium]
MGESGSGKSVSTKAIIRLLPGSATILPGSRIRYRMRGGEMVDVETLSANARALRRMRGGEIGMIFQEPMASFSPVYTIGNQMIEMIRLHQPLDKRAARDKAIGLLRRHQRLRRLAGGERRLEARIVQQRFQQIEGDGTQVAQQLEIAFGERAQVLRQVGGGIGAGAQPLGGGAAEAEVVADHFIANANGIGDEALDLTGSRIGRRRRVWRRGGGRGLLRGGWPRPLGPDRLGPGRCRPAPAARGRRILGRCLVAHRRLSFPAWFLMDGRIPRCCPAPAGCSGRVQPAGQRSPRPRRSRC